MSYLEAEIDESLENLGIQSRKLAPKDLDILIASLRKVFFCESANHLDPTQLRVNRTEYTPDFWQEVSKHIQSDQLIFVVFDTSYRAWEIASPQQLERILSDTTGYPFWMTDKSFGFLIYMDDHDCVSWAYPWKNNFPSRGHQQPRHRTKRQMKIRIQPHQPPPAQFFKHLSSTESLIAQANITTTIARSSNAGFI